jgi:hypothetical protein
MARTPRPAPLTPPRAPSQREWAALTHAQRAAVVAALPGEVTDAEMSPPEGDRHFQAKIRALDALGGHFRRLKRRVYLAAELPVYYPAERRFAPDLLAVFDVDSHERDKYVRCADSGRRLGRKSTGMNVLVFFGAAEWFREVLQSRHSGRA